MRESNTNNKFLEEDRILKMMKIKIMDKRIKKVKMMILWIRKWPNN